MSIFVTMNDYKALNNRTFLMNLFSGKIDFTPGTNYDFIFLVDKESDEDFIRKQEQLFAHFNFCFNIRKISKNESVTF